MRIAIVTDRVSAIERLRRVILGLNCHAIAWVALDGAEAVTRCSVDTPDLILMDLVMPVMDGVEATRRIMNENPCPILIVTPALDKNRAKVFEAMGHGALDAANIPARGNGASEQRSIDTLLKKIATIEKLGKRFVTSPDQGLKGTIASKKIPSLIVVGASTGGPKALAEVLSRLPASMEAGIIIAQHVDREFSGGLADWLDTLTPLKVSLISEGCRPAPATVYLAGTNNHLILTPNLTFAYTKEPVNNPYRPSVDLFFTSVAEHWPAEGVAVLLTGMGRDGAKGLAALRRAGWYTIAQDQATSVVYGMPKAAKELEAAVDILPIGAVAPAILRFLKMGMS